MIKFINQSFILFIQKKMNSLFILSFSFGELELSILTVFFLLAITSVTFGAVIISSIKLFRSSLEKK